MHRHPLIKHHLATVDEADSQDSLIGDTSCFDKLAYSFVVVLQCEYNRADLFQKVFRSQEIDRQAGRGEFDARRQLSESGTDELDGVARRSDLDMGGAGGTEQLGQVLFEAEAAPEFAVARLGPGEPLEGGDQFLAPADDGVAWAVRGAAEAQDAPSHGLGDAEDILQGASVDPVQLDGA